MSEVLISLRLIYDIGAHTYKNRMVNFFFRFLLAVHSKTKLYLSSSYALLPGMIVTAKTWQQLIRFKIIRFGFRAYLLILYKAKHSNITPHTINYEYSLHKSFDFTFI